MLHERLRMWEKYAAPIYAARTQLKCDNLFDAFADEIERDYIPKAVDVDGKVCNIYDPCWYDGDYAYVMGFCKDNHILVFCKGVYCIVAGDRIKLIEYRPPVEMACEELKRFSHLPDSFFDGMPKDMDAYIDQKGKDE